MARIRDSKRLAQRNLLEDVKELTKTEAFQKTRLAVDIAGIADPTPWSDGIGLGLSVIDGDVFGAVASIVSMVPGLGDAVAKGAKATKITKAMRAIQKQLATKIDKVKKLEQAMIRELKGASEKVMAKRRTDAMKRRAKSKKKKDCVDADGFDRKTNPYGTKLPAEGNLGTWKGDRGNSEFIPKKFTGKTNPDGTPEISELYKATGGKPIKYVDGYPDFSPFVHVDNASGIKAEVTMAFDGPYYKDAGKAEKIMKELTGDPDWTTPPDMVWHHVEDGVTMQLVPDGVNTPSKGGLPHTGGASNANKVNSDY